MYILTQSSYQRLRDDLDREISKGIELRLRARELEDSRKRLQARLHTVETHNQQLTLLLGVHGLEVQLKPAVPERLVLRKAKK